MRIERDIFRDLAAMRLVNPGFATGLRQGDRRSPHLGRGVEFADYRPYHPGDDLRMVDWNVYARLEQVLVRLFHEDRNLSVKVFVDASASMGFGTPRKLDHAGALAACIALVALLDRDSVTLGCLGGEGPLQVVSGQNQSAFPAMLKLLERIEPGGEVALARLLRLRVEGGRSDRVMLVSDLMLEDDERERVLRVLAASSRKPVLMHVLSPEELAPDLSEPLRVRDAETGEIVVVRGGADAATAYAEALHDWLEAITSRCRALRIQYVQAHTTFSLRALLAGALLRGRVVESAVGARA